MATALLLVIYLSYISLGLPDTLLGAAWPAMRTDIGASLDMAGIVSFVVSLGTVVSSLLSSRMIRRFGTGRIAFFSVLATALALFGFSCSGSFLWLLGMAVPLGLGAGAVDAGLNNFVALHYKAYHMNFLHCFWGIGAMSGPVIMSFWLSQNGQWRMGYRSVAVLQFFLVALLGLSLPLWKRLEDRAALSEDSPVQREIGNRAALKLPGVKTALAAFFCYCSLEIATGLWSSSYLVECRGVPADDAAMFTSIFYGGIALGRLLSGVLTRRLNNRVLIRAGQAGCAAGALLMLLPLPLPANVCGLLLFGLGCAPLYPAMLQETPGRFGAEVSQTVMGLQMAVAYFGSTVMPPLLGFAAQRTTIAIFPWFLLAAVALMFLFCEKLNRFLARRTGPFQAAGNRPGAASSAETGRNS